MTVFEEVIDKLKKVESELIITLSDVINDNSEQLEQAQRNQMSIGKNADNNNIGRLKNKGYALRKKANGGKAPLNIADLKNSGDFYKGIKASADRNTFTITSTDSKKDFLIKRYTEQIFGYNNKTFTSVKNVVLVPGMIEDIKKQLKI